MNFPGFSNKPCDLSPAPCPAADVLLDYVAGRLDRAQAALFERHTERCAHCAANRAAQTAIWRSLDEWKPEPVGDNFNREFWRRIDAGARESSWTGGLAAMNFNFWKRAAPLAVAMAAVATAFMLDHPGNRPAGQRTSASAPIVVTAGDADRLDRALDDIQLLNEADAAATPTAPGSNLM